jgi:GTPase
VDVTHHDALAQAESVMDTLAELGAGDKPVVIALNKADKLPKAAPAPEGQHIPSFNPPQGLLSDGVRISALRKTGLEELLREVEEVLYERMQPIRVRLPYRAGDLMALFRREGIVDYESPEEHGTVLSGRIPGRLLDTYKPYVVAPTVTADSKL